MHILAPGGDDATMAESRRTTIAIELDVLEAARERAEARGETLGKAVSDMMRESLVSRAPAPEFRNGIKLLPGRDFTRKVTVEDVDALLNEPE
jgi:hypothetical protein